MALLLLLTVSSILAACGGNKTNNAGTETPPSNNAGSEPTEASEKAELGGKLKVLTHRTDLVNDGTLDKYVEAFKAKYPKAEIEFEGLTNYATDIQVRLTTGEAGDVLMIPTGLATSEYSKYFEPLPDAMFEDVYFADNTLFEGNAMGSPQASIRKGLCITKSVRGSRRRQSANHAG